MTFVSITDTDGLVHRVNPHKVAKLSENSTNSTTLVRLSSGKEFSTTTARATVQASLESAMALELA